MAQPSLPTEAENAQPAYHVIPDRIRGGWNVYTTTQPQEPQLHFDSQAEALAYAEQMSQQEGVGFIVQENEAPERGE